MDRCRGTWTLVRNNCKKKSGSANPADWKHLCPDFIHQEDWEGILESWMTEKFKKISAVGARNRKSIQGEDGSSCSYVRHTGGSVNFGIHHDRMVHELGRTPNELELFERLHKKKKGTEEEEWRDVRAKKVAENYAHQYKDKYASSQGENVNGDEQSIEVSFDPKIWVDVIGGTRKKHIYGFGRSKQGGRILEHSLSSSSTKRNFIHYSTSSPSDITIQVQIQVEEKIEAHNQAQEARIEALNQAHEARIEALKSEMQIQFQEILTTLQVSMSQAPPSNRTDDHA